MYEYDDVVKNVTQEMENYYYDRTHKHINYVYENMMYLWSKIVNDTDIPYLYIDFYITARIHDSTKFSDAEYYPYVWLTHYFKHHDRDGFEYPDGVEPAVNAAWDHHKSNNRHHPEYHNVIYDMSELDICEMVCDWHAMSREFNTSTREWAERCIGSRWYFNDKQRKFIFKIVNIMEDFNG